MGPTTERRGRFLINLAFFAAIVAIVILALKYAVPWLMPFIIGFVIAMIFNPFIRWTANKLKMSSKAVACIVIVLGYAVLVTGITFGVIGLINLLSGAFQFIPSLFDSRILPAFRTISASVEEVLAGFPPEWTETVRSIGDAILDAVKGMLGSISSTGLGFVTSFVGAVPGFLVALVFTILASFFISMNYESTRDFLLAQFSPRGQEILRAIKKALKNSVFAYCKAYFKLMCITFVEMSISLLIIGVPNAVAISFGIACFDFLPVFGTGAIVIPWIIIDFVLGRTVEAVGLLIAYGIITVIRNFIEPKIVGDTLGLEPVVSIIVIYLGFVWFGVLGMIFLPMAVQIAISLHEQGIVRIYNDLPPVPHIPEPKPEKKRRQSSRRSKRGEKRGAKQDSDKGGET